MIRKALYLVLSTVAVVASGCARGGFATIPDNQYRLVDKGERTREVELSAPATLYGVELEAGSRLLVESDGDVAGLRPSNPVVLNELPLPAGTWIVVEDARTHDPLIMLRNSVSPPKHWLKVRRASLGGPTTLGPNQFGEGDALAFSDDGHLDHALLADTRTFGGKTYEKGSEVWFNLAHEVKATRSAAERAQDERSYERRLTQCKASCAHLTGTPGAAHGDCIAHCVN